MAVTQTNAFLVNKSSLVTTCLLVNDNKADATTAFEDQSLKHNKFVATNGAQYDTAQAPTGMTSSALFAIFNDSIDSVTPLTTQIAFGFGDFTVEFMVRLSDLTFPGEFFDFGGTGTSNSPVFYHSAGNLAYNINGSDRISGGPLVINTWNHLAICRKQRRTRMWLNGAQTGSTFADNICYAGGYIVKFGGIPGIAIAGWMSNIRITKGLARYTKAFTPPILPFRVSD